MKRGERLSRNEVMGIRGLVKQKEEKSRSKMKENGEGMKRGERLNRNDVIR